MPTLFCGIAITPALQITLSEIPKSLSDQFIGTDSAYLQKSEWKAVIYMGKSLGTQFNYPDIELMESNIHSLFKRLIPGFQSSHHPVYLFPLSTEDI